MQPRLMGSLLFVMLVVASPALGEECHDPKVLSPTDAEIRTMPTLELYKWWQLTRRAMDAIAHEAALGHSVNPCLRAFTNRQPAIEREMKFR